MTPDLYPHVDGVVLIRHLTYLYRAAGDKTLEERSNALDFGDENSLSNVFIPIGDLELVPHEIRFGLRAMDWDHPDLQRAADYRPKELVSGTEARPARRPLRPSRKDTDAPTWLFLSLERRQSRTCK